MSITDELAAERERRREVERLLEERNRELIEANLKLSEHATKLGHTVIAQREVVESSRAEADAMKAEAELMKSVAEATRAHLAEAEKAATIAERRLWDSVEAVTDGFAVFDSGDRMVAANSAWLSLFEGLEQVKPGVSYREMLVLMIEEGLVDPGEISPARWVPVMLERWKNEAIPEATIRTFYGRYLRLHDRRSRNGDMVCLAIDVTDERRYQRELKQARDAAEEATRAKSTFLAKMSHELRTPMSGVVGMADLLLDTDVDENQALYVRTIRNSGEALLEIINDVLDFSRAEARGLSLFPESFDLEALLCEVVMLSMPAAREKGLDLILDYAPDAPLRIRTGQKRLRQVIVNLLGNALKFTERGHVRVSVGAEPAAQEEGQWTFRIAIEDSGIGIAEQMREHIFEQFNQVEDEANRKFEGTGLGLAITRQLVELMGGEILLDSRVGEGTTFTLELPLEAEAPRRPGGVWPMGQSPRVIVATGSAVVARTALARAGRIGLELVIAEAPDALRSLVETGPEPDLIFTDGDFAGDDLLDLIGWLRGALPRTRIAHVVRHGQIVTRAALSVAGADRVITYPYRNAELDSLYSDLPAPPLRFADAAPAPVGARPKRMRVLAAEDNETNRLVFSRMLDGLDLDVFFAGDGRRALKLYQRLRPDLLFMDISMPGMDGKAATRAIRDLESARSWTRVPVVAMTAHAMSGDGGEILAAGLDHYLTKPLKKRLILEQIALHAPEGCDPFGASRDGAMPADRIAEPEARSGAPPLSRPLPGA